MLNKKYLELLTYVPVEKGTKRVREIVLHQGTKRVREIVLQTQVGHWDSSFDAPWGSGGPQWGIGIRPLMSPGDL